MALRYQIEAEGLSGELHRIEIHDSQFSGSVTQVRADDQFLRLEGGTKEHVGLDPIWGKEARFNVRTDKDLSPLFGLRDRQAEVQIFNEAQSVEVFRGHLLSDFFSDRPFESLPGIELRAADGLTLLENETVNTVLGIDNSTTSYSYSNGIATILGSLYRSGLRTSIAANWYPDGPSSLTSSENPLEFTSFIPRNFREDRNRGDQGDFLNAKEVLEDLCKVHGLVIKQAVVEGQLQWTAWQWPELTDPLRTWRYDASGTPLAADGTVQTGSTPADPVDVPISESLTEDLTSPQREFERRTQELSITHNHLPVENFIFEGGFEEFRDSNYSFSDSQWAIVSDSTKVSVRNHDTEDDTQGRTKQNQQFLEIEGAGNASSRSEKNFRVEQVGGKIRGSPPNSAIRVGQTFFSPVKLEQDPSDIIGGLIFRVSVGGDYLRNYTEIVQEDALPGENVVLLETGIERPIPKGARLPAHGINDSSINDTGADLSASAYITTSRRHEVGAEEIRGEVSDKIKGGLALRYAGFTSTESLFDVKRWRSNTQSFAPFAVIASLQNGAGEQVKGDVRYEIGSRAMFDSIGSLQGYIDNIEISIAKNGNRLSQTTQVASVEEFGQNREVTVRTASGPTQQNLARILGLTPAGISFRAINWGRGAAGGSLPLASLSAREQLDYLQGHRERLLFTAYTRQASLEIRGPELVSFDGSTYRVASFRERPSDGSIDLTLIEHKEGE